MQGGNRMIKAQDFDDRVDVVPVSDPNIFSMTQRITLAQTQLQMAQAAPDLHDLRAAYRKMYIALNVKDIDSILPPEEEAQFEVKDDDGKIVHIPRPVCALRIWSAAEQGYEKVEAVLDGAPDDRKVYWSELVEKIQVMLGDDEFAKLPACENDP